MNPRKIVKGLKRFRTFLITSHQNIEPDALTSELTIASLLRSLGKKVIIVNHDSTPNLYSFLPGIKSIINIHNIKPNLKFDAAIILDCSNLERVGEVKSLIQNYKPIFNIDHHRANENFGKFNWVKPGASSVAEMVYEIFKTANIKINRQIATLLYAGIMTDTGSFRFESTTSFTHKVISELLRFKIPVKDIYHKIYERFTVLEMRRFCQAIKGFKIDKTHRIAWITLKANAINGENSGIDFNDALFNALRSIKSVEVAAIFKEAINKKSVKINFRSQGKANVGWLAHFLGGGGHRAASGCVINGKLNKVEQLVLKRIKQLL